MSQVVSSSPTTPCFLSNKANKGGFVRIWQQSEVYLEKCSVRENKATSQGGSVYVPGSRVRISYTEFSRNSAIRGRDMYIVADGSYNTSSAPSVKLYTYRCVFTLNVTHLLTTDEYFMEEAQEGGLIYGNDVNVYNEETPYASGRYRVSQTSVLKGCPLSGITLDTPITIKAVPSMRPMAVLINIHDYLI